MMQENLRKFEMTELKISVKIQLFIRRKYVQFTSPN